MILLAQHGLFPTFKNLSDIPNLTNTFGMFGNDFEHTATGIFRKIEPPQCPECYNKTVDKGFNKYTKNELGIIKIGSISANTAAKC